MRDKDDSALLSPEAVDVLLAAIEAEHRAKQAASSPPSASSSRFPGTDIKSYAVNQALASSAIEDFYPTELGLLLYQRWIEGSIAVEAAVKQLKQFHIGLEATEPSDGQAAKNLLGITDSRRLHDAEADITTLRMAELVFGSS